MIQKAPLQSEKDWTKKCYGLVKDLKIKLNMCLTGLKKVTLSTQLTGKRQLSPLGKNS